MRYAVVIEKGERNFSAYVPDLPGCVSVGDTLEEAKAEIREAIEFHLKGCGRMGSGDKLASIPNIRTFPPPECLCRRQAQPPICNRAALKSILRQAASRIDPCVTPS